MATTVSSNSTGAVAVAIDKLHVPQNVRELDQEHVDALAGSIALQGLLIPVLVAPADGVALDMGFEYELVAGFHRHAAVTKLQHTLIDATVIDSDHTAADLAEVAAARATENVTSCRPRHDAINADPVVMPILSGPAHCCWTIGCLMSA